MTPNCPNYTVNIAGCPCTSLNCERRGTCCECVRNHRAQGNLPACLRKE